MVDLNLNINPSDDNDQLQMDSSLTSGVISPIYQSHLSATDINGRYDHGTRHVTIRAQARLDGAKTATPVSHRH